MDSDVEFMFYVIVYHMPRICVLARMSVTASVCVCECAICTGIKCREAF